MRSSPYEMHEHNFLKIADYRYECKLAHQDLSKLTNKINTQLMWDSMLNTQTGSHHIHSDNSSRLKKSKT